MQLATQQQCTDAEAVLKVLPDMCLHLMTAGNAALSPAEACGSLCHRETEGRLMQWHTRQLMPRDHACTVQQCGHCCLAFLDGSGHMLPAS